MKPKLITLPVNPIPKPLERHCEAKDLDHQYTGLIAM